MKMKMPQINKHTKKPQHFKKQLHLYDVLPLKPQESLFIHVSVEHLLKTVLPLNPASAQLII